MDRFRKVGVLMKGKHGKMVAGLTLLTTIIVVVVVFSAVLAVNNYGKLEMISQYVSDAPKIVQDREDDLKTRSKVFEEDVIARSEQGAKLYEDDDDIAEEERLVHIRDAVSAKSISLVSESGTLVDTTGTEIAMDEYEEHLKELEPNTPSFKVYSFASDDSEDAQEKDIRALVMLPLKDDAHNSLVFEFSCTPLLEVYEAVNDWSKILERMLCGLDYPAFVQVGDDDPIGYPLDDLTDDQREQVTEEVAQIFKDSGRFIRIRGGCFANLVKYQKQMALATLVTYPQKDAKFLLLVSFADVVSSGFFCAATISIFIVFSLILFLYYVSRIIERNDDEGEEDRKVRRKTLNRLTRPGRILLVVAVCCFTGMLLMLESRSNIAYIGTTKMIGLQNDIVWHESQRETIRASYTDIYRVRAQAAATFLEEHGNSRTHDDLKWLSDSLKADYLMLFDKNGQEIVSSNSNVGFSVGGPDSNLSDEYRAVLLGYPYVVVGPEKDPYTKKDQIGAAILLTKDEQADGFLLAVFDARDMNAELKKASLEYTVNTFPVAKGSQAAVINNEDGLFLAHTDEKMIGELADAYISNEIYGHDYAGLTEYDESDVFLSETSEAGKSLLFMVPVRMDDTRNIVVDVMTLVLCVIVAFIYCPLASIWCAEAMEESGKKRRAETDASSPLMVFAYGYVTFFTVMTAVAIMAGYTMIWPAFSYVFSGIWTRGVHLFSAWAALFTASVTLCIAFVVRRMLAEAATKVDLRSRTMLKLLDSFVAYAAGIILVLGVLYLFGVNTGALIASAGVLSIAIGMGSKDMVSDSVAGLFIAVEDSIRMGDEVNIGGWTGRVTNIGVRTTEITDENQNVKIINNSAINNIVNLSRKKTPCFLSFEIKCNAVSMDEAERLMKMAVEAATEEIPELYGTLQLEGIDNLTEEGFMPRLSFVCTEATRVSVARQLQTFIENRVSQDARKSLEA